MNPIELSYSLENVYLSQGSAFEPYLQLTVKVTFENNNPTNAKEVELFDLRGMVSVNVSSSDNGWHEVGIAQAGRPYTVYDNRTETMFELRVSLPPHILHKIEKTRDGKDLYFKFAGGWLNVPANVTRNEVTTTEIITLKSWAFIHKYPRSEWIDNLDATEFGHIELIELPTIDFPQMPLTSDIMTHLHDSERAMKEGRWKDVFGASRKALNALYNGIEAWGDKQQLTKEENDAIENSSGNEKLNTKRNIYFSRLVEHSEKGKRLNSLRGSLYQYLSLDTHEADHKGIDFTRDDAIFVSRATIGFIYNILTHLQHRTSGR